MQLTEETLEFLKAVEQEERGIINKPIKDIPTAVRFLELCEKSHKRSINILELILEGNPIIDHSLLPFNIERELMIICRYREIIEMIA